VDRSGVLLETPGPAATYLGFEVSPDGKRIAAHRHDPAGGDIVVIEPRGAVTKLTFDAKRTTPLRSGLPMATASLTPRW